MKIAYCFFGQPRQLEKGYMYVKQLLDKNPEAEVDFYIHVWYADPSISGLILYDCSKHRGIPIQDRIFDSNIITRIKTLYNPVAIQIDSPLSFDLSPELKSTKMYQNSSGGIKNSISSTLSQLTSRQYLRDLFLRTIQEKNKSYDFVVAQRFDFLNTVNIKFSDLDKTKLYCGNHNP